MTGNCTGSYNIYKNFCGESMSKKKGGLEKMLFQWAYQNRKGETRAAQILKSIEETEKALDNVKFKKRG